MEGAGAVIIKAVQMVRAYMVSHRAFYNVCRCVCVYVAPKVNSDARFVDKNVKFRSFVCIALKYVTAPSLC